MTPRRTFPVRISSPGPRHRALRPPRAPRGLTMIDLLLVIVLMAALMMISVPAFHRLVEGHRAREVNRLVGLIHMLRNDAVLTNTRYRLVFDLPKNGYFVEKEVANGEFDRQESPRELRGHTWPEGLQMETMALFGDETHLERDTVVPVEVDTSGFIDPFRLHLTDGEDRYTLRVEDFTGSLELLEGHHEK